jgi:hypothetical protein
MNEIQQRQSYVSKQMKDHVFTIASRFIKYVSVYFVIPVETGNAIPVTDPGGPWGCETSWLPHFIESRLTDGSKVSLTRRPPFTPMKIPGTYFC